MLREGALSIGAITTGNVMRSMSWLSACLDASEAHAEWQFVSDLSCMFCICFAKCNVSVVWFILQFCAECAAALCDW